MDCACENYKKIKCKQYPTMCGLCCSHASIEGYNDKFRNKCNAVKILNRVHNITNIPKDVVDNIIALYIYNVCCICGDFNTIGNYIYDAYICDGCGNIFCHECEYSRNEYLYCKDCNGKSRCYIRHNAGDYCEKCSDIYIDMPNDEDDEDDEEDEEDEDDEEDDDEDDEDEEDENDEDDDIGMKHSVEKAT